MQGVEIYRHLYAYWCCRGPLQDARRLAASLIELTPENSLSRAQCLLVDAALAINQNDCRAGQALADEMFRIGRHIGQSEIVAWSLLFRADVAWFDHDRVEALRLAESALALARVMDTRWAAVAAMILVSLIQLPDGDLNRVEALGEEGLAICVESGELWLRGWLLGALSQASRQRGQMQRAEALARDGAACKHAVGDRQGLAQAIEALAGMAAERGSAARAATLLGCARRLLESLDAQVLEPYRAQHERTESTAREQLGDTAFVTAFERGTRMTTDEAAAYVVEQKEPTKPVPQRAAEPPIPLTRRELEIALLIADGLTSREIAGKLFISDRTVVTHVTNMLNKLGLSSRIQLTRWVADFSKSPVLKKTPR